MVKVVSFLLTFLTVLLITTPTNSNVTLKEPHYWKPLRFDNIKYTSEDLDCLAKNIYFEARDQGTASHVAVSLVVLNRVNDPRYPNTICEVIYQGPTYSWKPDFPVRNKCQFSWYCDGKSDKPKELEAWNEALKIASLILSHKSYLLDFTEGSTHYHATHIKPHWAAHLTRIAQIEGHIFYRLEQ